MERARTCTLRACLHTLILTAVCGRFSITGDLDFYVEYFGVDEVITEPLEKSWNIAPTDPVYVISEREGVRRLGSMTWGLVPYWARGTRSIHINARSETVATNSVFRDSFSRKRCLIPADGFYEWEPPEHGRTPHWVYRADGHPMAFAGIWASRVDPETGKWHRTCSIITKEAEGVVEPIHDRMPVALEAPAWDGWLNRGVTDPSEAQALLRPIDAEAIIEHVVSRKVNAVRNDGPALREQIEGETLF